MAPIKNKAADWASDTSDTIVRAFASAVVDKQSRGDDKALDNLMSEILRKLTALSVYETLKEAPVKAKTQSDRYKRTAHAFSNIRNKIEDSVAAGFQGAMSTYAGKQVGYYCIIRTVPEPVNREPC